jgi:hypothetical protein
MFMERVVGAIHFPHNVRSAMMGKVLLYGFGVKEDDVISCFPPSFSGYPDFINHWKRQLIIAYLD